MLSIAVWLIKLGYDASLVFHVVFFITAIEVALSYNKVCSPSIKELNFLLTL